MLEKDGETVLEAKDVEPLRGMRPAYRAEGCFALAHNALVLGRNVRTYTFSDEPVDWWIGEGTWEQSTRWSCDPRWSFLGGWSRGDAVLWHKQRFTGDQYFDAFLGVRMEYPRERQIYDDRFRDLGITICGDGHNPRSGYAGIYLAESAQQNAPFANANSPGEPRGALCCCATAWKCSRPMCLTRRIKTMPIMTGSS